MDWAAFVESVPGVRINEKELVTPDVKRSPFPADSPRLAQVQASFEAWCASHGGRMYHGSTYPTEPGSAFSVASSRWTNREFVRLATRNSNRNQMCYDAKSSQLMNIMMIRVHEGYAGMRTDPGKLLPPRFAFYTPEQAKEFTAFYEQKQKEAMAESERDSKAKSERASAETRRLRSAPKVGDQAMEGVIIEVRAPLVLIQYSDLQRRMFGKPQTEWIRSDTLNAIRK